jgi:hypothetical protein
VYVRKDGVELIVQFQIVKIIVMKEEYVIKVYVNASLVGQDLNAKFNFVLIIVIIMENVKMGNVFVILDIRVKLAIRNIVTMGAQVMVIV